MVRILYKETKPLSNTIKSVIGSIKIVAVGDSSSDVSRIFDVFVKIHSKGNLHSE